MSFPKRGMYFEDVRQRLKKYESVKYNPYLKESLKNQARLHEGEDAYKELDMEFDSNNHSTNRLGSSPAYAKNYDRIFRSGSTKENPDSSESDKNSDNREA